jgi:hypothetical protein
MKYKDDAIKEFAKVEKEKIKKGLEVFEW